MSRNQVKYEWGREEMDGEEIINCSFSDTLAELTGEGVLVLVRNEGNNIYGLVDRAWAYVVDGVLPLCFSDELGNLYPNMPVPVKYRKEFENYNKTANA